MVSHWIKNMHEKQDPEILQLLPVLETMSYSDRPAALAFLSENNFSRTILDIILEEDMFSESENSHPFNVCFYVVQNVLVPSLQTDPLDLVGRCVWRPYAVVASLLCRISHGPGGREQPQNRWLT